MRLTIVASLRIISRNLNVWREEKNKTVGRAYESMAISKYNLDCLQQISSTNIILFNFNVLSYCWFCNMARYTRNSAKNTVHLPPMLAHGVSKMFKHMIRNMKQVPKSND